MRRLLILAVAAATLGVSALPGAGGTVHSRANDRRVECEPARARLWRAGEAVASSVVYQNSEVETHVAVNPTNPSNVVAYWQQDRWNDGWAHGNLAGYSFDGGLTRARSAPRFSRCAGGAGLGNAGDYQRATDPWLSFSPNGRLHAIALVFDNSTPRNAVLAAFSDNGGATWSTPRIVRFDNPRALGNAFNDKETLTADLFDANLVYATWQRILSPSEQVSARGYENTVSFIRGVVRALDRRRPVVAACPPDLPRPGRVHADDREPGRGAPRRHADQRFQPHSRRSNRHGTRGYTVALIRSPDKGDTWTRQRPSSTACWWTKSRS